MENLNGSRDHHSGPSSTLATAHSERRSLAENDFQELEIRIDGTEAWSNKVLVQPQARSIVCRVIVVVRPCKVLEGPREQSVKKRVGRWLLAV